MPSSKQIESDMSSPEPMAIRTSSPESDTAHRSDTKPVVLRPNSTKTITVRPSSPEPIESDTSSLEPVVSRRPKSKNTTAQKPSPEPSESGASSPEPLVIRTSSPKVYIQYKINTKSFLILSIERHESPSPTKFSSRIAVDHFVL